MNTAIFFFYDHVKKMNMVNFSSSSNEYNQSLFVCFFCVFLNRKIVFITFYFLLTVSYSKLHLSLQFYVDQLSTGIATGITFINVL